MGRANPPPPVQARTRLFFSWTSAAKEASLPEIRQRHDMDEGQPKLDSTECVRLMF